MSIVPINAYVTIYEERAAYTWSALISDLGANKVVCKFNYSQKSKSPRNCLDDWALVYLVYLNSLNIYIKYWMLFDFEIRQQQLKYNYLKQN